MEASLDQNSNQDRLDLLDDEWATFHTFANTLANPDSNDPFPQKLPEAPYNFAFDQNALSPYGIETADGLDHQLGELDASPFGPSLGLSSDSQPWLNDPNINRAADVLYSPFEPSYYGIQPSSAECITSAELVGDYVEIEAQPPVMKEKTNFLVPHLPPSLIPIDEKSVKPKQRSCLSSEHHSLLRKFFEKTPYPSEEQKEELALKIGIKKTQISNWFANARRREPSVKNNTDSKARVGATTCLKRSSHANMELQAESLQRWLSTSPEDEGILISTVAAAAQNHKQQLRKRKADSRCDTEIPEFDANIQSVSFNDRGYDSISMSGISSGASASTNGSQVSHGSWAGRRGRKRIKVDRQQTAVRFENGEGTIVYECTWCWERFGRKDSWKRHEESEHCPQKEYVCMLNGPTVMLLGEIPRCVFCDVLRPSEAHLREHRALECCLKPEAERNFTRGDNLIQHIKQMHKPLDKISYRFERWDRPLSPLEARWGCGFCSKKFEDWHLRATHIADHFCAGKQMASWLPFDTILNEYRCFSYNCDRSLPGNGFPRRSNLHVHLRTLHNYTAPQPSNGSISSTSSSVGSQHHGKAPARKRAKPTPRRARRLVRPRNHGKS